MAARPIHRVRLIVCDAGWRAFTKTAGFLAKREAERARFKGSQPDISQYGFAVHFEYGVLRTGKYWDWHTL